MSRPRTPRDAASLVLIRGSGPKTQLLMGRRAPRNRFMPDVYVFPGGGVSPTDRSVQPLSPLRSSVARALEPGSARTPAVALGMAAVRETWEETGLLLGQLAAGELRPDLTRLHYLARAITPSYQSTRYHARFFLAHREHTRGRLRGNGELLDLRWVSIGQARKLPIVDVTEMVLDEVEGVLAGERRRPPLISYRNLKPALRYSD